MVLFSPLPQTNLQFNNNKYYLIQLLEDDAQRNFSVWMRWGRGKGFVMDCVSSHSETSAKGLRNPLGLLRLGSGQHPH